MPGGVGVVARIDYHGYAIEQANGTTVDVSWTDLQPIAAVGTDGTRAYHRRLHPWWEMQSPAARQQALDRLEVVQEVLTGFRDGHEALAREGEPFEPFGPSYGVSLQRRCERMAVLLTAERSADRQYQRRILRGELKDRGCSVSTVKNWVKAADREGLLGLLDGRKTRQSMGFAGLDPVWRDAILAQVQLFDGDPTAVPLNEILRRARVAMKQAGMEAVPMPQRASQEFVSLMMTERGSNTRAQRSRAIRGTSGKTSFPAIRPGQVVGIDATRSDVMVWDELHERQIAVEVITAIDVATRCILACRVVPKSADAVDAGLILYDTMRPFHMVVDGTKMSDWRWAGTPQTVYFDANVRTERGPLGPIGTLQGEHTIPAVYPESIRCDHGSIFVSDHFRRLCDDLGIDLLLSRGRRPTDNAHMERWHSTLDAFWAQLPGYKGRNVAARGRRVEDEEVYTAAGLEALLRHWIAVDYHNQHHEGLTLAHAPGARLTPLEYFDCLLEAAGRIDIDVQGPYAFLPIKWGKVRHNGVEFENLTYDSTKLDDFRNVRVGQFLEGSQKVPFFYDPHDVSRVWFMDLDTEIVHEIPWRGRDRLEAPMTDAILKAARSRIKARGGNLALNARSTDEMILREITQLAQEPPTAETRALLSAASRRVETSERDHAEAQQAVLARGHGVVTRIDRRRQADDALVAADGFDLDEPWPDLLEAD